MFIATESVQREALDSLEPEIACGGRSTPRPRFKPLAELHLNPGSNPWQIYTSTQVRSTPQPRFKPRLTAFQADGPMHHKSAAVTHVTENQVIGMFFVLFFPLQALNDAKRELKFLLVYLHGDDHQDTDAFCRNTLCHPDVINFLNTHMLFWACSTGSPEGYRGAWFDRIQVVRCCPRLVG